MLHGQRLYKRNLSLNFKFGLFVPQMLSVTSCTEASAVIDIYNIFFLVPLYLIIETFPIVFPPPPKKKKNEQTFYG